MPDFIKSILRFLGFDRAVSFGILARLWSLVAGPVTMLVIATGFTPEVQGFYYTFSSLLALQIFFDLGLMFVISQFTSHEFVHLTWGLRGKVDGDSVALKRFTDLLCKTVLWFGIAALLMIVVLVPVGLVFFGQKGLVNFSWRIPWTLAVISTALNLFVTPFFAIIMGSGDVVTTNKRDLVGAVLGSILCWLVIGLHGGLYSAFAVNMGSLVIAWGYLLAKRPGLVRLAWDGMFGNGRVARKLPGLSWWGEIWPMQWRMAVSSGAAYFIFQLFTPVLFYFRGAVVAGKMGMTMTAGNSLMAIGMTVILAKNPEFAKLIARSEWSDLDTLFFKAQRQALLLVVSGGVMGAFFIWLLQVTYGSIGNRFIPAQDALIFFLAITVQIAVASYAIYLRSHKIDPLVLVTVIVSFIQGVVTVFMGKNFSITGVVWGYFIISLFLLLPLFIWKWSHCRKLWHGEHEVGRDTAE